MCVRVNGICATCEAALFVHAEGPSRAWIGAGPLWSASEKGGSNIFIWCCWRCTTARVSILSTKTI